MYITTSLTEIWFITNLKRLLLCNNDSRAEIKHANSSWKCGQSVTTINPIVLLKINRIKIILQSIVYCIGFHMLLYFEFVVVSWFMNDGMRFCNEKISLQSSSPSGSDTMNMENIFYLFVYWTSYLCLKKVWIMFYPRQVIIYQVSVLFEIYVQTAFCCPLCVVHFNQQQRFDVYNNVQFIDFSQQNNNAYL